MFQKEEMRITLMGNDIKIKVDLPDVVNKTLEKPAETLGDKISDLLEIIFGGITYTKEKLHIRTSYK